MEPFDARLVQADAQKHQRTASRRGLLTRSARVVSSGTLALAIAGVPGARDLLAAQAQQFADDIEILNFALSLEHLEHALYRDALEQFDDAEIEDETLRRNLEAIRDHEADHVAFLTQAIEDAGGTPVEEAEYDFGYEDLDGFLALAATIEEAGVAAYAGVAPRIKDFDILAGAVTIHTVEARHSAYLNWRTDSVPFPEAFDNPSTATEVLDLVAPFIVTDDTAGVAPGSSI